MIKPKILLYFINQNILSIIILYILYILYKYFDILTKIILNNGNNNAKNKIITKIRKYQYKNSIYLQKVKQQNINNNINFIRKLLENKVIVYVNGNINDTVNVLSNAVNQRAFDYTDLNTFFKNNLPLKVIVNSNEQTYDANANYLQVKLDQNGTNKIEIIWNKTITKLDAMFLSCESLISVDFTNFDFSSIIRMGTVFTGCYSLQSVDFGNADTSQVTGFNSIFEECISLKSLDLSSFNTSKVINMKYMFYNCHNLEYLDISNFDTTLAAENSIFFNCTNLRTINLNIYKGKDIFSIIPNKDNLNICNSNKAYSTISNCCPSNYYDYKKDECKTVKYNIYCFLYFYNKKVNLGLVIDKEIVELKTDNDYIWNTTKESYEDLSTLEFKFIIYSKINKDDIIILRQTKNYNIGELIDNAVNKSLSQFQDECINKKLNKYDFIYIEKN